MKIPIKIRTICGNIAATNAGIIPKLTSNHNTPYITIITPNNMAIL